MNANDTNANDTTAEDVNANDTNAQQAAPQPDAGEDDKASYARRIKAAGLDSGETLYRADGGVDMDAMRDRLSRKIAMFLNAVARLSGAALPAQPRLHGAERHLQQRRGEGIRRGRRGRKSRSTIRKALAEAIERRGGLAALEQEAPMGGRSEVVMAASAAMPIKPRTSPSSVSC